MDLKAKLNRYFDENNPKKEERKKAKKILYVVLNIISDGLKRFPMKELFGFEFKEVQFVGSEWEGTKIDPGKSDFDVVLCFTLDEEYFKIEKVVSYHSFDNIRYRIIPTQQSKDHYAKKIVQQFCDIDSRQLNPTKIVEAIRNKSAEVLNSKRSPGGTITADLGDVNTVGCSFAAKISDPNVKEFKSDISVAFDIKEEGKIRHMIRLGTDKYGNKNLWQESFSTEEKKLMKGIDSIDNGCRKKIYKILKAIKNAPGRNTPLHGISSYVLKNAIFHLRDVNWNEAYLEQRFKNTLQFLECAFEKGSLERYFEKGSGGNLLCRCNSENIEKSARLLKNIRIHTNDYSILLR